MCKRKPPFLNKKNLTLSIVSSLLKISVVSPVTRMTHQKKKWNGTCIWTALLLTLSTAAPSTATTLTGLGSDRASAIIRFWALVSADVIEKLLCFAILFSRLDFLSFPFKSCFSSSSYSPSSLTCPSCVDFFCHDMIRHETILFRSYPFFFVQGVTDIQRLGNINIRMWKVACDIPFSFFIFFPFFPLLFHRSTQSAQLENATSSMAIPWYEHEHNGLHTQHRYRLLNHMANRSVTKLDPFSTPNITMRVNALLTQPPVPQYSANSHGSGIMKAQRVGSCHYGVNLSWCNHAHIPFYC